MFTEVIISICLLTIKLMVNETLLNAHGNSYESFHTDVKTNTLINITNSAALVILIKDNLGFLFNNTNRDCLDCVV